jgi:hypothetical protein
MIYFEDSYGILSWDETAGLVVLEWKGFVPFERWQIFLNKVLELARQHKSSKLLADSSKLGPFSKLAEQWIFQDWKPRAIAAGLKSIAYIAPKNAITRQALRSLPTNPNLSAYFETVEEAREWLKCR